MDRLWAPWRMEYVKNPNAAGCFLCAIAGEDRDRDNLLLRRGRTCAVVLNRYPYSNGHLLVWPYRHVADLVQLTRDERLECMDLAAECVEALRKACRPHAFNVGLNLGRPAGAGLEDHLHLHVVPRWEGDTNFMPVLADTRVIPQSLTATWDLLHPLL